MWTTPTIMGFADAQADSGNFCYSGSGWFNTCTNGSGKAFGFNHCSNGTGWWWDEVE